ncbi:MAG: hypothetical protein R3B06_05385 [Kofleriaceae bacterium]
MILGPRFQRWGDAVVAPRRAMRDADRAALGGGPAVDLAWAVLVAVAVGYTRGLVATGWVGLELGVRAALAPLTMTLTAAATVPLATVALATLAIWAGAGRRRDLGRDADLACVVALVPTLAVMVLTAVAGWLPMARVAVLAIAGVVAVPAAVAAVAVARGRTGAP